MDRRSFLKSGLTATLGAGVLAPVVSRAEPSAPWSEGTRWRSFEVTTRVEVHKPMGEVRAWIPMPLATPTDYFSAQTDSWTGNASEARIVRRDDGEAIFCAAWKPGVERPWVELVSRFAARDRAVDFSQTGHARALSRAELAPHLKPTELIPIDGIVRDTAVAITRGSHSDHARAKAIYEWIVENCYRDPKVRGCGWGDIRTMLETGNLGGKCGDLSALFVGLARSVGIPARDMYGIRVAPSQWGYRSMSASGTVTGAQHCRAEFYLAGHGWVPVDPADVRKVILEEPPGHLPITDRKAALAREKLFGAWEMNWLPYNTAHDVRLPFSDSAPVPYLMYPAAETGSGRKDSLDPDNFRYAITARETTA